MAEKGSNHPIPDVMDIFKDRRALMIVRDMALLGKTHFGKLSASTEQIPPSTLTECLDRLAKFGIISKRQIPEGPGCQFRYEMTECGMEFRAIVLHIMAWQRTHALVKEDE